MEKLSVQQNSPKQAKAKKKQQIKVVYISNPMRFKTTVSEFKGLVQLFTGQDSDVADLSKFTNDEYAESLPTAHMGFSSPDDAATPHQQHQHHQHQHQHQHQKLLGPCKRAGTQFDSFNPEFTSQAFENLAAFLPSSLCYEPLSPVSTIRSLDAS